MCVVKGGGDVRLKGLDIVVVVIIIIIIIIIII
jgi:hypothetical protein